MSDELRAAAAERYAKFKARTDGEIQIWEVIQAIEDRAVLADAYIDDIARKAAEKADREKPIDEECCARLGMLPDGDEEAGEFAATIWNVGESEIQHTDGEPRIHLVVATGDGSIWLEAYGEGKSLALVEIARNATAARLLAILSALRGGAA
jgi:hypothetical protein